MITSPDETAAGKSLTKRIVISEPDEEQLSKALEGRDLTPGLMLFLKRLTKTHKWMRKINIPSGRNDLAAVLVFTSALKGAGLEMFSELHVFFAGKAMIEKWQVIGENEQTSALRPELLTSIDLIKVREHEGCVQVHISAPVMEGENKSLVRTFDFRNPTTAVRIVAHPLSEQT